LTGAALPSHAGEIAVLMSADVKVYEEALRGFKASARHDIVARYDMRGDRQRGRRLVREIADDVRPDLLLVIGLWALQAAVEEGPQLPIVYAMVLNPPNVVGAAPEGITGASMNVPVDHALDLLKDLGSEVRRIGVVHDPQNTGFLVEEARAVAGRLELELIAKQASTPREGVTALAELEAEGVDALWVLPDKTVLAPAFFEHMLRFSYRNRIPLLGISERHAEMGALVALYFASGEDIGNQAGELANQILAGASGETLPYTTAREVSLVVNLKTAKKIGVDIPDSMKRAASDVIR
jgi:putative ABC transport system substrate-binding protein